MEIAKLYRKNGADIVQVADPCSSVDLISPRMYADKVVPTLEKHYGVMKENYEVTMIHLCGKAGMRLPEIRKSGKQE